MSQSSVLASPRKQHGSRPGLIRTCLVLAAFGEGLLLGVIPAATPDVGRMFSISSGALTWISSAHLLAVGVAAPVIARLGDMYGHRRLLRVAAGTALIGGLLCAVAPDFAVFLLGRIMEGAIAAFTPLAVGIARARFGARHVRRTVTTVIASLTGGSAVGLLLAAEVFRATPSPRAVLWVPVACSAISFALLFTFVPETRRRAPVRLDWPGFTTLSGGLVGMLLGLANGMAWGWTSTATLSCIGSGVVLLVAWTRIERRARQPMFDLRAASRHHVTPFYLASLTFGCAYFGAQTATTYFLSSFWGSAGYGFGLDLTQIAFVLLPGAVLSMAGAVSVTPVAARIPYNRSLSAGCVMVAVGYVLTTLVRANLTEFIVSSCITQFGLGVALGSLTLAVAERAQRDAAGIATGLVDTIRSVGGATASAVFAALFAASALPHTSAPRDSAFVMVWLTCAGAAVVTMLIVAVGPARGGADARLSVGGEVNTAESGALQ